MEIIGESEFGFMFLRNMLISELEIKPYAAEVLINQLIEKQLIETVLRGKSPVYKKKELLIK